MLIYKINAAVTLTFSMRGFMSHILTNILWLKLIPSMFICRFCHPKLGQMCWLTTALLENVRGVVGALLSPLSGRLFHDFPEMRWKDSVMTEWKKVLRPFSDGWLVGWTSLHRFRNPSCAPKLVLIVWYKCQPSCQNETESLQTMANEEKVKVCV